MESLAQQAGRTGKAGESFRVKLISHITSAYLSSPQAARALTAAQWRKCVSSLAKSIAPADRIRWRRTLRSAFVGPKVDLAALGSKARPSDRSRLIDDLAAMLGQLGDKDVYSLKTSVDIASLPDFTKLSGDALAACASKIERLGQPAAKIRDSFIAHLRKEHLADDNAARSLTLAQWRSIASMLRRGVGGRTREEFAARLRSAFAGAPQAVRNLRKGELAVLIGILQTLGDKEAGDLEVTHIEATGAWRLLTAEQLASLASRSGQLSRSRIIAHVESEYLAAADGPKSLTADEWGRLAGALAADLSPQQRAMWISIAPILLLEDMRSSSISSIRQALGSLGGADAASFVDKWMARHDGWKSWKPVRLVTLVERARRGPETGAWRSVCKALESHVNSRYFADVSAVRDTGVHDVQILVNAMAGGLSGETRFKWIARIRSAFLPNEKAVFARKLPELRSIVGVLTKLGDSSAVELNAVWMAGNAQWHGGDLVALTRFVRDGLRGKTPKLAAARAKAARFISASKLNSPSGLKHAGVECAAGVVAALASDIAEEDRAVWVGNMLEAFGPSEQVLGKMEAGEFTSLTGAIGLLDRRTAASMTAARLSASESWTDSSVATLIARMKPLARAGDKNNSKLLARLDAVLVDRRLDWEACRTVHRAYANVGDYRRAQTWTKRMYEAILGSKKSLNESGLMSLYCVADDMHDRGLTRKGTGYNEYARGIVERARQGSLGGARPGVR